MMRLKEEEQNKWLEYVEKELNNLETRKVWVKTKMKNVPHNRKLIRTKWLFKIK